MSFTNKRTSLISILSSDHGRLRREQRDIDKRDLKRALKHGTIESAWGQRYKVEYDGITFITDQSRMREVTAYPSPLPEMEIDHGMRRKHEQATKLFHAKPGLATSHTVLVIDNSGSMLSKKNNVHLYRDSQNAAFSMTALEFVAEQLFTKTAVNSDLLSLVKFSSTASIEINREPIDWLVYNKLLTHRNTQSFKTRESSPVEDIVYKQSNYLPALTAAEKLLNEGYHEQCALSLFFFSDGCPTDDHGPVIEKLASMARQYGEAFAVTMVGLGNTYDDFHILESMASAATEAGSKGSFELCNKTHNSMTSAMSTLVTTTGETRIALQEGRRRGYTQRNDLTSEKDALFSKFDWQYATISDHFVYDPRKKDFVHEPSLPRAAAQSNPLQAAQRFHEPPPYLAVNKNFMGKGAERVAFRCRLSDKKGADGFVFDTMIAKETKDVERLEEKVAFHTGFAETQDLASYLAKQFNQHLEGIPDYDPKTTPVLAFLECSVLLLVDPDWPTGHRGVLVEKMLDTNRFQWTKWNDNNGMVNGKLQHVDLDVAFELKELERENNFKAMEDLGVIAEGDEDSDCDDSVSDVEHDDSDEDMFGDEEDDMSLVEDEKSSPAYPIPSINPSDYLQAFTHFTYRYTSKKVMVCDLQGVFNTDMSPPTFELTDPAIHYASAKGRRMVFGRTDKGKSGMNNFFRTHKCTKICKYLQLSAKNRKWERDWRRDYTESPNQHRPSFIR